ncbi:oxygen-insensitive NADPH nitroreductase [Effusibacillus lacus]|uniref:NADPH-dependent oxidoreductase n=1 Tax=Effusibacillus lacus TaxID=1348429 RepID=A0A292YJ74_9BACL|nr:oxygen-insensitive NADPH nitroreductase [Effusibacillus lacus]TCS74717.1 FMN reductase (NADPH) [Effusibacillus lacus]GAX88530.1 NADPH-dependent oxidoreductase [Effusibacillus lacus]
MNQTVKLLQQHRSIRKYKTEPLSEDQILAIIQSAQMASSSSNVQAYSVIGVTDPGMKKELAVLTGNQAYVEQCPLFLIWCADMFRLREACTLQDTEMVHGTMENFIVATVDVALAAQNAAVAAESMGLGIVYIGGIRNNPREVSKLLMLPELVYPVFGMCVGVPDHDPGIRPRLASEAVYHRNTYDSSKTRLEIEKYDQVMREYYLERTKGKRDTVWSKEMADKYRQPVRAHMRAFLEEQGFRFE